MAADDSFTIRSKELRLMPTYEYRCEKCGKKFALVQSIALQGRKRPSCPKCKSARVTQLFSPFHAKTAKKS